MNSKQRGFTLIELVLVITIIGILAAFAIPRFAGIETEARVSVMQGLAGSLEAAAALAHSKQLAQGLSAGGAVNMEDQVIGMTLGYPSDADIDNAIRFNGKITSNGAGVFNLTGFPQCTVTYKQPATAGAPPQIDTSQANNANCQ